MAVGVVGVATVLGSVWLLASNSVCKPNAEEDVDNEEEDEEEDEDEAIPPPTGFITEADEETWFIEREDCGAINGKSATEPPNTEGRKEGIVLVGRLISFA